MMEFSETITVEKVEVVGEDAVGIPITETTHTTVEGVGVSWQSGDTEADRGTSYSLSNNFLLPPYEDIEITPLDRIIYKGNRYVPQGNPQDWVVPPSFGHLVAGRVVVARAERSGEDRNGN